MHRPAFSATFVATPGVDGLKAFRMLLKAALRHYGLRAIDVRERAHHAQEDERARAHQPQPGSSTMSEFSDRVRAGQQRGYLKVADLDRNTPWTVTISHIDEQVEIFGETKDVLCFENTNKALVLNQTTSEWLLDNLGDDPTTYPGKRVVLHLAEYKFKDETKLGIRLKLPDDIAPARKPPMTNTPTRSSSSNGPDPDDSIPY